MIKKIKSMKAAVAVRQPAIGDIVIYTHPADASGELAQSPAIVQNVAPDGSLRLFIFAAAGQHIDTGLTQGDGPTQWKFRPE
jgi:hypothetical protein